MSDWQIDGTAIPTATSEEATFRTLSFEFRVTTANLTSTLRPLRSDEGKVTVLSYDDGGFTAIDRAQGSNTYTLTPPARREPLRQSLDYHVESYEEEMVSQTDEDWNVSVTLIRTENRTDSPSISETRAAQEWAFDTQYGQLTTDRVTADVEGTGKDGIDRLDLTMTLTMDQAHVWEAAHNRQFATGVDELYDSSNDPDDDTGGTQTVTVTSPNGTPSTITDGDYVVLEWSSKRLNDAYQQLETVLAPV
jgi:hypothetical protein